MRRDENERSVRFLDLLRPINERSVLLLRAIAELKYSEIAEALDMPLGTVMSHLARARKK